MRCWTTAECLKVHLLLHLSQAQLKILIILIVILANRVLKLYSHSSCQLLLSFSSCQIIYQDIAPPSSHGIFIPPAIVVPPSHCSPCGSCTSTLLFRPPHANATIVLLGDLAGPQLAASSSLWIILYANSRVLSIAKANQARKIVECQGHSDSQSIIFRVSTATSSSLQVGKLHCSSILNKIKISDTSPASHTNSILVISCIAKN
jgi:hypothetical protein